MNLTFSAIKNASAVGPITAMFGWLCSALAFHNPQFSRRQAVTGFLSATPGLAFYPTRTSAALFGGEGPQAQLAALVKAQADLAVLEVTRASPDALSTALYLTNYSATSSRPLHGIRPDQLFCHSCAGSAGIRRDQEQRRRRHGCAAYRGCATGRDSRADGQGAGFVADTRPQPAVACCTGRLILRAAGAQVAARIGPDRLRALSVLPLLAAAR